MSDAIKMGAYGAYVWSSYGLSLLGLVYLAFSVRRSWQQQLQAARRRAQIAQQSQGSAQAVEST